MSLVNITSSSILWKHHFSRLLATQSGPGLTSVVWPDLANLAEVFPVQADRRRVEPRRERDAAHPDGTEGGHKSVSVEQLRREQNLRQYFDLLLIGVKISPHVGLDLTFWRNGNKTKTVNV